jgi:uncharacterized membrane protein
MDNSNRKNIDKIIKKELSRRDKTYSSSSDRRNMKIRIISVIGGIIFFLSVFRYYGNLFVNHNSGHKVVNNSNFALK